MVEHDAGPGETVDVRALDMVFAVAAKFRPQIVDGDEKDVRTVGGPGQPDRQQAQEETEK